MIALLTLIWGKVWKYVCALGAILVAIGSVWLSGRSKGKAAQKSSDDALQAKVNAQAQQQTIQAQESRNETDAQVDNLPAAPAQQVGTADPGTAAGELQNWTRD